MASPGASPALSASSGSSRRFDQSRPQTLEDLVNHFVASKRSLNTQTVLWRANEIVTAARELLEENAILAAKNSSLRNIVDEQVDALEAVRRGIDVIEAEVQTEFKVMSTAAYRGRRLTSSKANPTRPRHLLCRPAVDPRRPA